MLYYVQYQVSSTFLPAFFLSLFLSPPTGLCLNPFQEVNALQKVLLNLYQHPSLDPLHPLLF